MSGNPEILDGKYRLGEELGSGGMGVVYRARHLVLDRDVAVKLLHVAGDPLLAGRFLREARVAAAVRHPNVVDVLDFGTTEDGRPFMVLELLEGRSLADVLDDGVPLSIAQRLDIVVQVLSGLEAVHRAGMVHRDIKPANVFLSPRGDGGFFARLLDFGISFAAVAGSDLSRGRFGTVDGLILGTPEYMSAEQCEGRPDVDARSDLHSVGVMLYELLSGVLPYSAPHAGAVLRDVMLGKHVALADLRPDLPELAALVEDAISNDRSRRPQSAAAFRERLLAAAATVVAPSPPPEPVGTRALPTPLPPQPSAAASNGMARRRGLVVGAAAITLLGVIAVAAGSLAPPGAPAPAPTGASAPTVAPPPAPVSTPVEPDAGPSGEVAPVTAGEHEAASVPTSASEPAPRTRATRRSRRERTAPSREAPARGAGRIVRELDF